MPRLIPAPELETLVAQIAANPEGLDIGALAAANAEIPRRSLQRRLAALVADQRLIAMGQGRARLYRAPGFDKRAHVEMRGKGSVHGTVERRSQSGIEVENLVNRPIAERIPIGYERALLERYIPNQTTYLGVVERAHLHALGRSPDGERPAGTYARQIFDRLLIDLSWASSLLEGNTYTRLDTQNLIAFGREAEGKDRLEAQMILNHKAAIELLVDDAEQIRFNRYTIQNLHALLSDNLMPDPGASGRLRRIAVQISGTVYQPTAIPQLIEECFDQLLEKAEAIGDPFEQAFFAMVHIPYLQPFEDVNKRVSRLAANIPLIRGNLAPLSFVDLSVKSYVDGLLGVYELGRIDLLRDVFLWAYERSCQRYTVLRQSLPEPDPLRMKYRAVMADIVGEIVRRRMPITTLAIQALAAPQVDTADLADVVAMAINELHQLHQGNIARFRLRPAELIQWQEALARSAQVLDS